MQKQRDFLKTIGIKNQAVKMLDGTEMCLDDLLDDYEQALNISPVIEKKYTQQAVDILKQIAYREGFNDAEPSSR